MEELSIKIKIADIDRAQKLNAYKKDLKADIRCLEHLKGNIDKFAASVEKESVWESKDTKLQALIQQIRAKRAAGENNGNQKVIIFTVYKDTAEYLFRQLKKRGFDKMAMVSGAYSMTNDSEEKFKKFEPIFFLKK